MRPWERARQDATEWTEAVQLQNAYWEAVREVDAEAATLGASRQGHA